MSMTIEHLSKCVGASKFGNCVNCGIESNNGKDLTWISFAPNNGGYHSTICLCRKCRFELVTEIMTDFESHCGFSEAIDMAAVREEGENHDDT